MIFCLSIKLLLTHLEEVFLCLQVPDMTLENARNNLENNRIVEMR